MQNSHCLLGLVRDAMLIYSPLQYQAETCSMSLDIILFCFFTCVSSCAWQKTQTTLRLWHILKKDFRTTAVDNILPISHPQSWLDGSNMAFYLPTTTSEDCLVNKDVHVYYFFLERPTFFIWVFGGTRFLGVCIGLIFQSEIRQSRS